MWLSPVSPQASRNTGRSGPRLSLPPVWMEQFVAEDKRSPGAVALAAFVSLMIFSLLTAIAQLFAM